MATTAPSAATPKSRTVVARVGLALAAAGAITLTACGSDSGKGGFELPTARQSMSPVVKTSSAPSSSAPASSSTVPSSEAPSSDAPSSDLPSGDSPSGAAQQALLDATEVGNGYARTDSDTVDDPLPCTTDKPGPLTQVPPQDHGQIDFQSPKGDAAITERIVTYASPEEAQRAVQVVRAGYACDTAVVKGQKLYLVGPNDIREVLTANLDTADNWDLRTGEVQAEFIVVSTGSTVVQMAFVRVSGADTGDLDPKAVLEAAIAKAVNGS